MRELIDFSYLDSGKDPLSDIRHSHEKSYEIIFVKSGNGIFVVNDRVLPLEAGALYLINGMTTHCSVPDRPDRYQRRRLIVEAELVDRALSAIGESGFPRKLLDRGGSVYLPTDKLAGEIDGVFLEIQNALTKAGNLSRTRLLSYVLRIFLLAHDCGEEKETEGDAEMARVLAYLGANFKSKMTLDSISSAVHMSRYYLCHRFKERLGMTVFEYILQRRLSLAKDRLISTSIPISQISEEAGFSDFSYFSKVFRERMGVSPRTFREQNGASAPRGGNEPL